MTSARQFVAVLCWLGLAAAVLVSACGRNPPRGLDSSGEPIILLPQNRTYRHGHTIAVMRGAGEAELPLQYLQDVANVTGVVFVDLGVPANYREGDRVSSWERPLQHVRGTLRRAGIEVSEDDCIAFLGDTKASPAAMSAAWYADGTTCGAFTLSTQVALVPPQRPRIDRQSFAFTELRPNRVPPEMPYALEVALRGHGSHVVRFAAKPSAGARPAAIVDEHLRAWIQRIQEPERYLQYPWDDLPMNLRQRPVPWDEREDVRLDTAKTTDFLNGGWVYSSKETVERNERTPFLYPIEHARMHFDTRLDLELRPVVLAESSEVGRVWESSRPIPWTTHDARWTVVQTDAPGGRTYLSLRGLAGCIVTNDIMDIEIRGPDRFCTRDVWGPQTFGWACFVRDETVACE